MLDTTNKLAAPPAAAERHPSLERPPPGGLCMASFTLTPHIAQLADVKPKRYAHEHFCLILNRPCRLVCDTAQFVDGIFGADVIIHAPAVCLATRTPRSRWQPARLASEPALILSFPWFWSFRVGASRWSRYEFASRDTRAAFTAGDRHSYTSKITSIGYECLKSECLCYRATSNGTSTRSSVACCRLRALRSQLSTE